MRENGALATGFLALFVVSAGLVWSCLSSPPPSARARGDGTRTAADPEDVKERLETLSPEEQVPFLQSLLSQHTENPRLSFYLGNAYLNLSKPDSAIVHYAEALKFDSTYAKAHVNMAIAFERMNRFDEAKDHYEKAIEIDSTDVLAYCHLGHYYHVRGEMGEAVARYQRALAIDPESAQAHYNLGLAFADSRLFGEALVEWKKVVALAPDSEIGRTAAENVRLIEAYVEMDKGSSEGP